MRSAACHDFGGGGCAISVDERFDVDDDVWLDGAEIEGERHPLHGRATVVWTRPPKPARRRATACASASMPARSAIRSIVCSIACSTDFSCK